MSSAVRLREDYSAEELRALARRSKTVNQSRRPLSLAAVRDGMDRGCRDEDRRDGPPDLVISFSKVSPDTWPPVAASVSRAVTRTRLRSRWTEPSRT